MTMLVAGITALALAAGSVYALEDSSPLIFYSTSNLEIPTIPSVSSASSIRSSISGLLSQCPTTNYVVISQSGVSAEDYLCPKNTPFLRDHSTLMIRDVIGDVDATSLTNTLTKSCGKDVKIITTSESLSFPDLNQTQRHNKVFYTALPSLQSGLSKEDRKVVLQQHDHYLSSLVDNYFGGDDYTLVYITQSLEAARKETEQQEYQAEIPLADVMHSGELRRSLAARKDKIIANQTIIDGPLFDKYQFLSPGIFMGLLVGFVLLMILYVGISALSSLQVTYGAFDKEQGQLANKKQQ